MSSFLVQNKSINSIVATLSDCVYKDPDLQKKAVDLGIDVNSENWEGKLAKQLFEMNCEALRQRYQDTEFPFFHYQYAISTSLIQVYKSLQCFLYQCSEGYVPNATLYKFLRKFEHRIANTIITELPEYEEAEWE